MGVFGPYRVYRLYDNNVHVLVPNASISIFEVGLFNGSLSKHAMISPGRISRASFERELSICTK
jgi:hypothetical protein